MNDKDLLFKYCLRMGDTHTIFGHRLGEWCSNAHILEEDIALTNIALDHLGVALAWLEYAAELEGKGQTADDLAYRRDERQYFNLLIAEQRNGNFADTMARQFLYDTFAILYYRELGKSADERLAGIAGKAIKEASYHFHHSSRWVVRLGDGTDLSRQKMQKAIDDIWSYTGDMFDMDETDKTLAAAGVGVDVAAFRSEWREKVKAILDEATLTMPEDDYMHSGSREGIHTEQLGHLLAEMQFLPRAYPDAKW